MTTSILIMISILLSGLLSVFILNAIVNSRVKNKIAENESPVTVVILKAILFVSVGLLLNEVVGSFITVSKVLPHSFSGKELLFKELSYFSIFVSITIILNLLILWLATMMFTLISNGGSIFIEVANNNLNAILLYVGIILALTIVSMPCLTLLLDNLIPYPTLPIYH